MIEKQRILDALEKERERLIKRRQYGAEHVLVHNAIRIIEELEGAEEFVHPEPSCELTYITDCCCDLCGVQLIREDIFCRGCGRPIKWHDE